MAPSEFELVIFDCDGVLVDSEPLVNRVYVDVLRELGIDVDFNECLRELAGAAMSTRLEAFRSRFGFLPGDDFEVVFGRRLNQLIRTELRSVDGVEQLIAKLSVPFCVASNGSHAEIRGRLDATGLLPIFRDAIFSVEDVLRPKPAPDIYLFAAARMEAPVARCIVVEDSVPGVIAAVAAGMTVFGLARLTSARALQDAGASPFATMDELAAMLQDVMVASAEHEYDA